MATKMLYFCILSF